MKDFPKCLCIAATSMVQPVLTAAWQGTLTVPGMAYPAPGITQQARMQNGESVFHGLFLYLGRP